MSSNEDGPGGPADTIGSGRFARRGGALSKIASSLPEAVFDPEAQRDPPTTEERRRAEIAAQRLRLEETPNPFDAFLDAMAKGPAEREGMTVEAYRERQSARLWAAEMGVSVEDYLRMVREAEEEEERDESGPNFRR